MPTDRNNVRDQPQRPADHIANMGRDQLGLAGLGNGQVIYYKSRAIDSAVVMVTLPHVPFCVLKCGSNNHPLTKQPGDYGHSQTIQSDESYQYRPAR